MPIRLTVLLAVALPCAAVAQEGARAAPSWSLGAGVQFGGILASSSPLIIGNTFVVSVPSTPSPVVSLERRVGERTWLAVGLAGSFESLTGDRISPALTISSVRTAGIALSTGLRFPVTRPAAPVEVSLLALGELGYSTWRIAYSPAIASATDDVYAVSAGASLGLAVERELLDRLAVRIATSLLRASWSYAHDAGIANPLTFAPATHVNSFSVGVNLVPLLELRLAF